VIQAGIWTRNEGCSSGQCLKESLGVDLQGQQDRSVSGALTKLPADRPADRFVSARAVRRRKVHDPWLGVRLKRRRNPVLPVGAANSELWFGIAIMCNTPGPSGQSGAGCNPKFSASNNARVAVKRGKRGLRLGTGYPSAVVRPGAGGVKIHEAWTRCSDWRGWLSWISPL
jgi:hypothetical protein